MQQPLTMQKIDSSLVVDSSTKQDMQIEARKDGGLPQSQYERWLSDLREQPSWRNLSDKCADYYDGNQRTPKQLEDMEKTGMAPIIANITRPTIDVVLGMEAKTRQDWRVQADGGQWQDVAEALSMRLMESEREAMADRACSDAYAAQIKAGLGWVEVSRSLDPYAYPYRCGYVHRREIWWDWRSKQPDLSDARYLIRRRWVDLDEAMAIFPKHAEVLEQAGDGRFMSAMRDFDLMDESYAQILTDAHQLELRTTIDDLDWRDTARRRLCLGEFWYRTWCRGMVIKIGGKIIPVDTNNPHIAAAVAHGKVKIQPAIYPKVRLSWWAGPHRLADTETKRRHFPYIPFWGFREDRTGAPYGLIRPMLDPQDEYNARRSKLMWLLSAKRVKIDSDALDKRYNDIRDVADEVNRPDSVIVLDPNRKPGSDVKVDTDHNLASQQFTVMGDAKELLNQTAGVYQAMMGQESGAKSGYAINSLVEQGATTLAEINDNYRYARRLVGQHLLDLIVEDIGGEPVEVSIGEGKRERVIVLNQRTEDGNIANDVMRAKYKVSLSDVPSTPSYRAQQLQMLTELTKSLPPNIQGMIIDFVMEATDLPNRKDMAERIRQGMGVKDPEELTPEQQAQMEQQMQAEQAQRQRQIEAELSKVEAEAEHKAAQADKTSADADKVRVETQNNVELSELRQQMGAISELLAQVAKRVV